MRLTLFSLLLCVLLLSASSIAVAGLPISLFEFSDYIVTVTPSEGGPLYSVTTGDGISVDTELSEEEALSRYPELHGNLESSAAGSDLQSLARTSDNVSTTRDVPISVTRFSDSE